MMTLDHLSHNFETQFVDKEITPASIDEKIRLANSALMVVDPSALQVRFSIGKPIDDVGIEDWQEDFCGTLVDLPSDCVDKSYKVYEVWYDGDDGVIEVMIYIP